MSEREYYEVTFPDGIKLPAIKRDGKFNTLTIGPLHCADAFTERVRLAPAVDAGEVMNGFAKWLIDKLEGMVVPAQWLMRDTQPLIDELKAENGRLKADNHKLFSSLSGVHGALADAATVIVPCIDDPPAVERAVRQVVEELTIARVECERLTRIVGSVVRNLNHLDCPQYSEPGPITGVLWGKVAHVCGLGSTSAIALCREFKCDPDFDAARAAQRGQ